MKKMILFLSAVILLLCLTTCKSDEENKGRYAKNIPDCVKEKIKNSPGIIRCREYCNTEGTKKIYELVFPSGFGTMGLNESCKSFLIESEEYTPIPASPDLWDWGYLLPDGTMEYKEDIYHFKRIVFTQK
ncbi:MAG: hypothetical protein FWC34_01090 [Bacteroidetes bacterium]|nr:hypothetical protein [Bacteroidota bacterium]MCL2302331.1 hypothetical protein [Lentimicrobiaceae bacterium]